MIRFKSALTANNVCRERPSEAVVGSQWSICPNFCEASIEMTLAEGSDCARDLKRVLDKKVGCCFAFVVPSRRVPRLSSLDRFRRPHHTLMP